MREMRELGCKRLRRWRGLELLLMLLGGLRRGGAGLLRPHVDGVRLRLGRLIAFVLPVEFGLVRFVRLGLPEGDGFFLVFPDVA